MAKPTKKQVKKIEKQLAEGKIIAAEKPAKSVHVKGVSPSGLAVAKFLISELGTKDAKRIASGMVSAARTKSMKKRLARIEVCVESASESAEESAA